MIQAGKIHRINGLKATWWLLLISVFAVSVGCKSTRRLGENEYLLKKNKLEIAGKPDIDSDELKDLIRQKPNRKTFLIWSMHLRLYNLGLGKNQEGKFKSWLRRIGEKPVIYDSTETAKTVEQMERFLFQHGYFKGTVKDSIIYNNQQDPKNFFSFLNPLRNKKKVILKYRVEPEEPYIVASLNYNFLDPRLENIFKKSTIKWIPIEGEKYDYKKLDDLRKQIATCFQNQGFFDFKKNYIKFRVDSAFGDHTVHINARILNPVKTEPNGEKVDQVHTRYRIDKIYIYPNYNIFQTNSFSDTIRLEKSSIIYNKPLRINPKLLPTKVFINKGLYIAQDITDTYKSLNDMGLYRSVNIDFEYQQPQTNNENELLDAYIYLNPLKRHTFSVETRLETRAYSGQNDENQNVTNFNFGVNGSVSLSRINAFKNGETLRLSLSGGLEPFFLSDSTNTDNFFNTVEFGPRLQLTFPRFLLPISQSKFAKSNRPQTQVTATYNLLKNDDFFRRATKLTFGYFWLETPQKLHRVTPIDISFVNAQLSNSLQDRLDALNNPFLNNTYSDQVILASSYIFTYRQIKSKNSNHGWYNRVKVEGAGNTFRGLAGLFNDNHRKASTYQLFGITYAQYLSVENDFRYYHYNRFDQTLATRLFIGAAKPLENLDALPFEKSFFAGGSNGIRAWQARTLGPGSYLDTNSFSGFLNRIGEIKIEGNVEYRFDLVSFLEAAIFLDAGNIWVFKERANREGTEFDTRFYNDLAIGTGFGLRLDFDFFIIRFDLGYPLRDPTLPENERWFYQEKTKYNSIVQRFNQRNNLSGDNAIRGYRSNLNFNIGIGYPF
ncbi:translocation and assembly module lipoprotein TamL [Luteibaculum oceani]|uniref:BamA/TamA family outer membrane protein n=1 Tax=Luteibaculum oceani TaxID=1294296 RepID=A0A5C6V4T8_9FLAO|nr:BamA/TamA family outer membrane protein [Luteibaculum oceani]TXC78545.1 BamA/TamA family outer membrane protein [Luteibaculum oceani]